MSELHSLKRQNAPLIRAVLLVHVVVFAIILIGPERLMSLARAERGEMIMSAGWPTAAALVYAWLTRLLLLGLLPASWRDRLIHWRLRYPLPGARAFSVIGPNDSRVDMDALATHHGPLPEEMRLQDLLFYKVYRQVRDEAGVLDPHGNYLAARDVATINAFMMIGLPFVLWWFSGEVEASISYASALALAYLLSAWAAQQYGVRFVQNVLAVAASTPAYKEDRTV